MEAVQMVQNPGTLVSGKIGASVTGQTGDASAMPIFEQMFAQVTATAGMAEQAAVEPGLQRLAVQTISLSDIPELPLAGRIPVLSPTGDPAGAESTAEGAVEATATARIPLVSEAGFTVTQMLVPSQGKTGKTLERKDSAQGKDLEKKGEPPPVQPEGVVKSVIAESGSLIKLEVPVESLDESGSDEISISLDEKKSEGFFAENGTACIPVITPQSIVTPRGTAGDRAIIPGAVFSIPARSAFAGGVESAERGKGGPSPVPGGGTNLTGAPGEIVTDKQAATVEVCDEAGSARPLEMAASSEEVTVMTGGRETTSATTGAFSVEGKNSEEDSLKNVAPAFERTSADGVAQKSRQGDIPVRESLEIKNTVKGEDVIRQVPSGVTVANPAQTIRMGTSPFHAEMKAVTGQGGEAEAKSVRETADGNQVVSEALLSEADQGVTPKNISVSSGEGASQQNAGEGKEGRQVFAPISAPGSFETALRGRKEEILPTLERTELHESILSQVREKLAAPEAGNGNGQITLKLNPRELGDLQIHLRMQDSKVSVEITAQNQVVRDALVQNLDQLKETLSRQNIPMERFDVMNGNGQSSNQSFREGRQAAQPHVDDTYYPDAAYYPEDPGGKTLAFGDARQNTLVDMRF
jgi:flagellar hook-length control protein FliK